MTVTNLLDPPPLHVVQVDSVHAKLVTVVRSVILANLAIINLDPLAFVSLVSYYILATIYPRND